MAYFSETDATLSWIKDTYILELYRWRGKYERMEMKMVNKVILGIIVVVVIFGCFMQGSKMYKSSKESEAIHSINTKTRENVPEKVEEYAKEQFSTVKNAEGFRDQTISLGDVYVVHSYSKESSDDIVYQYPVMSSQNSIGTLRIDYNHKKESMTMSYNATDESGNISASMEQWLNKIAYFR